MGNFKHYIGLVFIVLLLFQNSVFGQNFEKENTVYKVNRKLEIPIARPRILSKE